MENKSFTYIYSAEEQDEIKRIRQKYQSKEEDGVSKLRKMDAMVTRKATVVSLVLGIIGALVMGTGMSLIMTEFGSMFGLTENIKIVVGMAVGFAGIIMVALAYPVYGKVLRKEREKIAPEIIRLTEALMK